MNVDHFWSSFRAAIEKGFTRSIAVYHGWRLCFSSKDNICIAAKMLLNLGCCDSLLLVWGIPLGSVHEANWMGNIVGEKRKNSNPGLPLQLPFTQYCFFLIESKLIFINFINFKCENWCILTNVYDHLTTSLVFLHSYTVSPKKWPIPLLIWKLS